MTECSNSYFFTGGEGQSVFYTGFLDNNSTNGHNHPQVDGKGSPTTPNGSTTLPAK